jgi:hypothetical protein
MCNRTYTRQAHLNIITIIHNVALPPQYFKIELPWVFLNSKTMLSRIQVCKQHNQTKTTTYELKFTTQN